MASAELSLTFFCGLRGYHEYRAVWTPRLNEVLSAVHERTNPHDRYAIAARKRLAGCIGESTVGHLPKEISRVTRFIMLYGAVVTVKVLDTHHRRSPLVQGGLEIPIQVRVKMEYSSLNKDTISRYEDLVNQYYKEPVEGKFEDITAAILDGIDSDTDEETDDEPAADSTVLAASSVAYIIYYIFN